MIHKKINIKVWLAFIWLVTLSMIEWNVQAGINDGLVAYYCFEDANNLGKDSCIRAALYVAY